MNTRKSFWLVEGGKVTPAAQDTPFDGLDNVLVFARTSVEAALIAKAYEDLLVTVDNVTADNGEVVAALSMSDDALIDLIDSHLDSDDPLVAEALSVLAPQTVIVAYQAAELLKLVAAEGCVQVTAGVYLQTADNLTAEQLIWDSEDKAADTDFSVAPFWITTDSGDDPVPVEDKEDSELLALVFENLEAITNTIKGHKSSRVMECEIDPESGKFSVSELPAPTKIQPEIKYFGACPWAVVKTIDGKHSLEVSLTNLHYDVDGKPYLLAYQQMEYGPQDIHLYLI